ncbi:hypothetical protein ZEAMMB73_Zm00001d053902 [Zea mays]|uniref:Uncharacterized protein n=1 Tax=Zea mays TaxID=4577 RepID=A0A1D6QTB6_MAIZE|nr:hypothetical protein ZEAMMB73_Zm00001d053902 [Zea mays]
MPELLSIVFSSPWYSATVKSGLQLTSNFPFLALAHLWCSPSLVLDEMVMWSSLLCAAPSATPSTPFTGKEARSVRRLPSVRWKVRTGNLPVLADLRVGL